MPQIQAIHPAIRPQAIQLPGQFLRNTAAPAHLFQYNHMGSFSQSVRYLLNRQGGNRQKPEYPCIQPFLRKQLCRLQGIVI